MMSMYRKLSLLLVSVALLSHKVSTQELPPGYVDPQPILEAAAQAIGTTNLRCITISGEAYGSMVGQQRLAGYDVDWPRGKPLRAYTRTMNWDMRTMTETFD
ncbi:uncharacterized protein METZ01_LOCUS170943, partial [marine metagenome]